MYLWTIGGIFCFGDPRIISKRLVIKVWIRFNQTHKRWNVQQRNEIRILFLGFQIQSFPGFKEELMQAFLQIRERSVLTLSWPTTLNGEMKGRSKVVSQMGNNCANASNSRTSFLCKKKKVEKLKNVRLIHIRREMEIIFYVLTCWKLFVA